MDHLIERYRDGRISSVDFLELKHWLESDPDVPHGKWYKRFKKFILAGHGEMPSTFLTPGMAVELNALLGHLPRGRGKNEANPLALSPPPHFLEHTTDPSRSLTLAVLQTP